jgi:hypothetical protein
MKHAHILYHLVRADFLERVRRYSFLLTLAFAVYLAYATGTGTIVLRLGDYRGLLNSAWVGSSMTLIGSCFLSLVGFYIVKNAILRDEQTRVGQILASTPMSRSFYTLAKAASNFAVLALMMGVLALAALGLQFFSAEDSTLHLYSLLAPFLWVGLPAMAMAAAVAVLFETLPILRGGIGNVIYFFAWIAAMALGVNAKIDDFMGFNLIGRNMQRVLRSVDGSYKDDISLTIVNKFTVTKTFLWNGVDWSAAVILHRLLWVAAAIGTALVASLFFHRFDPARRTWTLRKPATLADSSATERVAAVEEQRARQMSAAQLTPIARASVQSRFPQLLVSELRLMLKGQRWWWYAVAAGLFLGSLFPPTQGARAGVLVVAWLWPILLWSNMGMRESRFRTAAIVFSAQHAVSRQLLALWSAGVLVALLTGGGYGLRWLFSADWPGLISWIVAAVFIPTMALAFGVWTGQSKLFEALYTVWWYIGPLHHTAGLDFMGLTPESRTPVTYGIAAAVLLTAAYWKRRAALTYA